MSFYENNYETAGDDWTFPVLLEFPVGTPYVIASGSTVQSRIVSSKEVAIGVTQTHGEADPGNDWPNGIVVPYQPASETVKVTSAERYVTVEIQIIELSGVKRTWYVDNIPVRQGAI